MRVPCSNSLPAAYSQRFINGSILFEFNQYGRAGETAYWSTIICAAFENNCQREMCAVCNRFVSCDLEKLSSFNTFISLPQSTLHGPVIRELICCSLLSLKNAAHVLNYHNRIGWSTNFSS